MHRMAERAACGLLMMEQALWTVEKTYDATSSQTGRSSSVSALGHKQAKAEAKGFYWKPCLLALLSGLRLNAMGFGGSIWIHRTAAPGGRMARRSKGIG